MKLRLAWTEPASFLGDSAVKSWSVLLIGLRALVLLDVAVVAPPAERTGSLSTGGHHVLPLTDSLSRSLYNSDSETRPQLRDETMPRSR